MPPVISILHLRLKGRRLRIFLSIPAASFRRAMRTSICAAASAGTTLVREPPLTMPTLTVKPFFRSVKPEIFSIWRASSNRVHAFLEIEAGMGRLAGNFDAVIADSFARGFYGAVGSVGGLEHEYGRGFFRQRFGDGSRRVAAHFLVGNEQDGDGARQYAMPFFCMPVLQGGEGVEHQGDARFHVEDAGAGQFVTHDLAGHGGERAERVDGVVMAQQQHGPGGGLAGKIYLQVIAEVVARWIRVSAPSWANFFATASAM
jgi:hypothetical protein